MNVEPVGWEYMQHYATKFRSTCPDVLIWLYDLALLAP